MAHIPAEQRRQDFIEAAVRVIAAEGVRGATTRKIAAEADAPLATLHYCFQTKEKLFFAVFQHIGDALALEPTVEEDGLGLIETAAKIMTKTVEWAIANTDYALAQYDLYLWAIREEDKHPGIAAQVYDLFIDQFSQVLHASLGPGEDARLIKPLAHFMLATLDGMTMQWDGHHDDARLRGDLEFAIGIIEAFIAKQAALATT